MMPFYRANCEVLSETLHEFNMYFLKDVWTFGCICEKLPIIYEYAAVSFSHVLLNFGLRCDHFRICLRSLVVYAAVL